MNHMRNLATAVGFLVLFTSATMAQLPDGIKSDVGPDVPAFKVRPGYRVTRALPPRAIREARFLQFSDDGKTLYVSQREQGAIIALRDPDADGVFKTITTFAKDRANVHGLDFHDGWLYFSQAAEGSLSRARDTNGDGIADDVEYVLPPKTVPSGRGHRYDGILITDKQLYVTTSDPTNMTPDPDSPRKTIYVFDAQTKERRVFCTGVRNNEKLRFCPGTTEIWGLDNGTDNFGKSYGEKISTSQPITDLNPPEEFNRYVEGGFYGHPYLSGNRVPRPEYADRPDLVDLAAKTIPPEWNIHAHWAALGFTFVTKDYFPGHRGDVFFASHGSWNSIKPTGAVIERVLFDQVTGKPYGSLTIVDCQGERRWARPVDCAEAPDGTIVFSCDEPQAAIYRISKTSTPSQ